MVENTKKWPRVHTCLYNWCPEKRDDCGRCDAVLEILRKAKIEKMVRELQSVVDDGVFVPDPIGTIPKMG